MMIKAGIVVFSLFVVEALGGGCPSPSVISPCTCKADVEVSRLELSCSSFSGADVKTIFAKLDKDFNQGFNRTEITLHNLTLTELPANTFNGIHFHTIYLPYNKLLARIDINAFSGSEEFIDDFQMYGENKMTAEELFPALHQLKNLKRIILHQANLTRVPAYALKPFTKLDKFWAILSPIGTIESHAFSDLPDKPITLQFTSSEIDFISANTFASEKPSSHNLTVRIEDKQNWIWSTTHRSLTDAKRPLILDLTNPILYVPSYVFQPYLDDNKGNVIVGAVIDCSYCGNNWLKWRQDLWSRFLDNAGTMVKEHVCSNGNRLDDSRNFQYPIC